MKNAAFNLLPAALLVAIVSFWANAPSSDFVQAVALIAISLFNGAFVQALELVHERHAGWRIDRREFLTDGFYLLIFVFAIPEASQLLIDGPLLLVKARLGIETPWIIRLPFVAQVALTLFLIEFGQYWLHRLMHNWRPFWLIHAPHHHLTQLNAMKGAVGNPIELLLVSVSVVALFDVPQTALFCTFNVMNAIATFAHANVRADPPRFYAFFFTTIRHHSLHHSVPFEDTRCNYANCLILLDRIFGTYREGEADVVGQDDRRRLSIKEQFLFPFQPLIDAVRRRGRAA